MVKKMINQAVVKFSGDVRGLPAFVLDTWKQEAYPDKRDVFYSVVEETINKMFHNGTLGKGCELNAEKKGLWMGPMHEGRGKMLTEVQVSVEAQYPSAILKDLLNQLKMEMLSNKDFPLSIDGYMKV